MIKHAEKPPPRDDLEQVMKRDFARHQRRENDRQSFWRSLKVLGMIGWPIAIATAGGGILGRYLDTLYNTGVHFTLLLLAIGALAGSYAAWRTVRELE